MTIAKLISSLELPNEQEKDLIKKLDAVSISELSDVMEDPEFSLLSKFTSELGDEKKLFQGAGGDVFQCLNQNSLTKHKYRTIVIKRLLMGEHEDPDVYRINSIKEFMINLKASALSDQVVHPIDLCLTPDLKFCLVLPYHHNSDLLSLLTRVRKNGSVKLSTLQKNLLFYKIVHIVLALHKLNIIHRDIKPENILINDNGGLELTDFGYAIDLKDLETDLEKQRSCYKQQVPNFLNFSLGTKSFKPPELHAYDENGNLIGDTLIEVPNLKKLDIWSLLILYFQLSRMVKPWNDTSPKDRNFNKYVNFYKKNNLQEVDSLACSAFNNDPMLSVFDNFDDDDLKTLLLKMLNPDPNTRYDIKQVMRNNWCLGLNDSYEKLMSQEKDELLLELINSL